MSRPAGDSQYPPRWDFRGRWFVHIFAVALVVSSLHAPLEAAEVPKATAIERLRIVLPEQRYRSVAQGWVETIAGGTFGVTRAAFEDVFLAPPEIKKRVLDEIENSSALVNLFKSLDRGSRQQLVEVLLPFGKSTGGLQDVLTQELRSLSLSRDDLQYVSNISILLRGHASLRENVQGELLRAVGRAKDQQVRQAVASVASP